MAKKGRFFKVGLFLVLLFLFLGMTVDLAEAKTLNVPLFSQLDRHWAGNKLGSSNLTIGNYGCALTSKAMVFNYYSPNFTDPARLNRYFKNHNGYVSGCLIKWNNVGVPAGVNYAGGVSCNRGAIDQKLESGFPLIAQVYKVRMPMHFVVITGNRENNILINDPWQGVKTSLEKRNYHLRRIHLYQKHGTINIYQPKVKKLPALRITQGLWLKNYHKAYTAQPFDAQFTVKNFSSHKIALKNLVIAVRGPKGENFDLGGSGKITLKPKQSYRLIGKTKHLGRRGVVGTYRFSCNYRDSKGNWHLLFAQKTATNKRKLKVVDQTIIQPNPSVFQIQENFDNESNIESKDKIQIENGEAILDSWQKVFTIQTKDDFERGELDGIYFDDQKQRLKIKNPVVKILQIYPPEHNQDLLKQIIDRYAPDPGIFEVNSVSIRNFNQEKFDDGKNLDLNQFNLLYFGAADVYGSNPPHWTNDLNALGENLVRQFHAQGKGIIFTHDTLGAGNPCWLHHHYFSCLSDITGIITDTTLGDWSKFSSVCLNPVIDSRHPMLNYPFIIPQSFSVLPTHRLYQRVVAGSVFAFGESPSDLYWQANNNVTFFSYGNIEKMPLEWEGKALINALSNTYQGGSFQSEIFDLESDQGKVQFDFQVDESPLTEVDFGVRFGSQSDPSQNWSDWIAVSNGQLFQKGGCFCQFRVKMRSANLALSPLLQSATVTNDALFYPSGSLISQPIFPDDLTQWLSFDFQGEFNQQDLRFDILDGVSGEILIANLKSGTDLSGINSRKSIRVRLSLFTNNGLITPKVDQWVIYYQRQ